jgi:hypothetical protein
MDLASARTKYEEEVPDSSTPFKDWLADPYGGGPRKATLDADKADVDKQQQILNQLIAQSDDKQIDSANKKFDDKNQYTNVVSSTLPAPVQEPGYGQVDDYATWVQQNAGKGSKVISWDQTSATSSYKSKFANVSVTVPRFFWSVHASGQWREMSTSSQNSSLKVTLTFKPWGQIPVRPLGWYDEGVVNAKINNPEAYRSGYSVTKPASGQGAWALGQGGIMPCRLTDFLVCYQPEVSVELSSGFSESESQYLRIATGVRIGPFSFGGSGGQESSFSRSEASRTKFTGEDTSTFPRIFGIFVKDFRS